MESVSLSAKEIVGRMNDPVWQWGADTMEGARKDADFTTPFPPRLLKSAPSLYSGKRACPEPKKTVGTFRK